jgi:major membrane immunogen (membrane-anchored lipoprotein)
MNFTKVMFFSGVMAVSLMLTACNKSDSDKFSGVWKLVSLQDGRHVKGDKQSSLMRISCKGKKCQVETETKSVIFDYKPVKKISEWTLSDNNTLTNGGVLVMSLKDGKIMLNNFVYEKQTE